MPTQTTPQRLRQIIDLIEAAKTMVELKAVLDTLTPEEHIDYEAWAQDLPGHIEPDPPIKPEPIPAPRTTRDQTNLDNRPHSIPKMVERHLCVEYKHPNSRNTCRYPTNASLQGLYRNYRFNCFG